MAHDLFPSRCRRRRLLFHLLRRAGRGLPFREPGAGAQESRKSHGGGSGGGGMASRAKRRRAAGPPECREEEEEGGSGEEEDSDSESDDDEEEEEEEIDEEVNIEFEAHAISDNDKNGIKRLLQQLFLKAPVNTSELTDILIQQNHIGSIIKQAEILEESDEEEDDEEVFGFISLLNLTERKGTECAEQIKELILSQCEKNCEQNVVEQLDKLLSDTSKPVGLLLSERFINVPPQIALPMHRQLQKELIEAQRTNKPCGKCYYYLLISKTFTDKKGEVRKKGSNRHQKEELMFSNAEEEFFYEKSLLKFSYSVEEESDSCLAGKWSFEDVPMKPLRTVMVIPTDRMDAIMDKLKEYLSV